MRWPAVMYPLNLQTATLYGTESVGGWPVIMVTRLHIARRAEAFEI